MVTFAFAVASIFALASWDKATIAAIQTAKEQDRRYFLECLRKAQSIDDLNLAGLFAYLPISYGPEFVSLTKSEVEKLKQALVIEPEWFDET